MKTTTLPKAQNNPRKQKTSKGCRPRRPLNAYNMFFAIERNNIIRKQQGHLIPDARVSSSSGIERAHVGFANLARIVSERWKTIEPNLKEALQEKARLDKIRYQREMKEWKLLQKMNQEFHIMTMQAKLDVERMKQMNNVFDRTMIRKVSDNKFSSIDCDSPIASRKEAIDFFRETSSLTYVQSQDRGALCDREAFDLVNGAGAFSFVQRQDHEATLAPELFCVPCSSSAPHDAKTTDNDTRGSYTSELNVTSFDCNPCSSSSDVFSIPSIDPFRSAWPPGPADIPLASISMNTVEMMRPSPRWNDQCHKCDSSSPPGVGRSIYSLDDFH
ncbi:hypothetical protein HJC23_012502 [Cyclotella cryptica]|uniref:HMG box domain-containing protein n=1 Tax=Cyclotella cryptica TaxID=29204 RepID=A0ABD3P9H3_9STRA|eukprot:CCRYP_016308-RA/>CCRYP_016308-RA protein AED:0.20 eAED:0.20 QI:0/-1/0/1/-1/1/1/0/329